MGKLLLVDDEEEFLDTLRVSLTRAGFDVLTAPSALEALRIIKSNQDPIDCVLTDYRMPEMRGDELAFAIKHKYEIPILIMTGDHTVSAELLFKAGISGVLVKPFNAKNFIEFLLDNDLQLDISKQRKFLRQKLNRIARPIELSNGRLTATGEILNMSNGGMAVRLDKSIEPMTTVQFVMKIDDEEIKGYMHCRWKVLLDQRLSAGFEFDSLTKKSLGTHPGFAKLATIDQVS